MSGKGRVFILEGSVGAGKSSLALATKKYSEEIFGKGARVAVIREGVNDLFLGRCIADPARYALPFQICMARDRIEAMRVARMYAHEGYIVLVDRGLPGDITFARMHHAFGNISDDDLRLYFSHLLHGMPHFVPLPFFGDRVGWEGLCRDNKAYWPVNVECDTGLTYRRPSSETLDVIVYLHVTPAQARARVERRGNAAEVAGYDEKYFTALHDHYEATMKIFEQEWGTHRVARFEYGATPAEGAVDEDGLPTLATCLNVWKSVPMPLE